jgi:uroporphyrinogen decarboxylase
VELMAEAGADAVSLGTCHDLAAVKAAHPNVAVQGNVDCRLLARGTPQQIRAAVRRCLQSGGGHRHILNLNHGVLPHTPVENFAAFVEAARAR